MDFNYFISELNALIANAKRIKRELEQAQAEEIARPPQVQPAAHPPAPPPSEIHDPLAKTMADMVTPKQLGMIRALGREKGVDYDVECQQVFNCKTEDLSKRAASSFIDHLKTLEPGFTARRAS